MAPKGEAKATGGSRAAGRAKAEKDSAPEPAVPSVDEQHVFLDAAKAYDFATVRKLVEQNPLYVNVQPGGRWSALHQAAEAGDVAAVKFLIENGASLDSQTKDGKTPLEVADADCADLLKPPTTTAPKRPVAPEVSTTAAKRAKSEPEDPGDPTLYVHDPASFKSGNQHDTQGICRDGLEYAEMISAPHSAKTVADQLKDCLATHDVVCPHVPQVVIVISNPGEDPGEACLSAFAIIKVKHSVMSEQVDLWDSADLQKKDWSSDEIAGIRGMDRAAKSDSEKSIEATKIMADKLANHFEFTLTAKLDAVPVVCGGYAEDGSIVGLFCMAPGR